MKLTKTIFLYLNEKEFSTLTKDAERANMCRSEYIRQQIYNAKIKPTLDMYYDKQITISSFKNKQEIRTLFLLGKSGSDFSGLVRVFIRDLLKI
ncbi:MAG: hypothetical protein IJE14_12120 [Clostridia bacterium]|nr:hypothetical protein [Clostridia bacterium]